MKTKKKNIKRLTQRREYILMNKVFQDTLSLFKLSKSKLHAEKKSIWAGKKKKKNLNFQQLKFRKNDGR